MLDLINVSICFGSLAVCRNSIIRTAASGARAVIQARAKFFKGVPKTYFKSRFISKWINCACRCIEVSGKVIWKVLFFEAPVTKEDSRSANSYVKCVKRVHGYTIQRPHVYLP